MLTISQAFVVLIIFLLIVEFFKLQKARKQFPPGPTPLPLLGNLLQLHFQFHRDLLMEVFLLRCSKLINSSHSLNKTDILLEIPSGIILATGHSWKQQRRFGIMTLRSLGMGKKGLEYRVQEEAAHLVEFFVNLKGRPVDPSFPLFHSISNVICALVFGYHFSDEDKTFHELISITHTISCMSFLQLYEMLPWLMNHLPGPHKKALSSYDVLSSFARKEIRRHVERGTPDEPQDFIDFYLLEMEKVSKDSTLYDEDNLIYVINDLFLGGSETSSTTLYWGLLFMLLNPDIQEKVQKELDAILDPSQLICYEDRRKLPYTNAVVHEIQRFSNIVCVGMPRVSVRDTTLLGFPVKKVQGTIIIPNIASALYDPEQWETPRQFNPGHFLDKEGNFIPREAFLPFSAGHRVCLGENLARTELFIFFANLLRAFTFRLPEGVTEINPEPILGGTLQPHPYRLCAIPR
uniref:Cytochrome P450 n=1 Tax=Calidris pygmaea TaxID=425635 RepID=A0A8C3PK16_9CHAR